MAISKQAIQKCDVERFNPRKLNDLEAKKQNQIKISNRFAAWENIKENIKTSAKGSVGLYELKQHKLWSDECLRFLDQRKLDKAQWLQQPNQSSVGNINNIRRETSRHIRNKRKEHLKAKIDEFGINSKIKKNTRVLKRGINDFKKGSQLITYIVRHEKGDLVRDFQTILVWWRNHFCQLFNVHGFRDVRHH